MDSHFLNKLVLIFHKLPYKLFIWADPRAPFGHPLFKSWLNPWATPGFFFIGIVLLQYWWLPIWYEDSHLRWLPRVVLRLISARYHCLPNVSNNRAFKNDISNPKQKRNHFSTWKALNHFGISSNSFKLRANMCLWQKSSINNQSKSSNLLLLSRMRYMASPERVAKWIPTRDTKRVFLIFVTSHAKISANFLAFPLVNIFSIWLSCNHIQFL